MFKQLLLTTLLSITGLISYSASNVINNTKMNSISDDSFSPVNIKLILSALFPDSPSNSWWDANDQILTFQDNAKSYDLIENDINGQLDGSYYTSQSIGYGMLISAMIMYIYQTQDTEINYDQYTIASNRFMDGYNYWVAAESSLKERDNKKTYCTKDKLLIWSRDKDGNPVDGASGSDTAGDLYMTGAVYLAALAYKLDDQTNHNYKKLMDWARDRAAEISSHDFNNNMTSSRSNSTPSLPGFGDASCSSNIENSSTDVEPSRAVLPIMYLFSKETSMDTVTWKSLIGHTLTFMGTAQSWSETNFNNDLLYSPYYAHQDNSGYIIDSSGSSYNINAIRNAENLGGYLTLSMSDIDDNTIAATTIDSQLIDSVISGLYDNSIQIPSGNTTSYIGTSLLSIYGLSRYDGQSFSSQETSFYTKYVLQPGDYSYNNGHWLMSALWMYMKLPSTIS